MKWVTQKHWERFVQLPGAWVLRMCVFVSVAELEMGGWGAEEDKTCSVSLVKDRRSPSTLASASYSCLHTAPLCPLVLRKPPSCLSQQHHCSLTLCMYPEYKQQLGRERSCVISVHFLFYLYFSLCDCVRACVRTHVACRSSGSVWETVVIITFPFCSLVDSPSSAARPHLTSPLLSLSLPSFFLISALTFSSDFSSCLCSNVPLPLVTLILL